jgi:hypothetical protein
LEIELHGIGSFAGCAAVTGFRYPASSSPTRQ